jgi:hypothetical protein
MADGTRRLWGAVADRVERAVEKNWQLSKKTFDIRPEYLLTVAIAESLSGGFEGQSGLDAEILLEEPTWSVIYTLVGEPLGLHTWLKVRSRVSQRNTVKKALDDAVKKKAGVEAIAELRGQLENLEAELADEPWIDIGRHGRVDIFLSAPARYRSVVEVKGFDPAFHLIESDLRRIAELLSLNTGNNSLAQGFVVFPSVQDRTDDINNAIRNALRATSLHSYVHLRHVKTGENPEDGMPGYVVNVVEISRAPIPA